MNVAALIKFYREESNLDALMRGVFYCNAPEYYRLSEEEGVGDNNESCIHSFRKSRGDPQAILVIDCHELKGLSALTTHGNHYKDMWLHCWTAFEFPPDYAGLRRLAEDLATVRENFGLHYAVMEATQIVPFVNRLSTLTDKKIVHGLVDYSDNEMEWHALCKASRFAYQREYRFAVGQCAHTSKDPFVITDPEGFGKFIRKDPVLKLGDQKSKHVWLQLDTTSFHVDIDA